MTYLPPSFLVALPSELLYNFTMENHDTLDDLSISFDENLPAISDEGCEVDFPPEPVIPESTNKWDPRLILDLAIGIDGLEDILLRYDLSEDEFNILSGTQSFRRELALTIRDVRENGVPFAQKAKVQAESYLMVLDELIHSPTTPANVRLEAIRSTVKWGKLEPKEAKDDGMNATQINVNISF